MVDTGIELAKSPTGNFGCHVFDPKVNRIYLVVDTGIEPVTPSMSRKCATAAPIDRAPQNFLRFCWRWRRDLNPWVYSFAGCCFGPLSHSTMLNSRPQPWQGCALPTEPHPRALFPRLGYSNRNFCLWQTSSTWTSPSKTSEGRLLNKPSHREEHGQHRQFHRCW
ncbi:MAG: hypothetical protein RL351_141 [Actinomycetota bacterium]